MMNGRQIQAHSYTAALVLQGTGLVLLAVLSLALFVGGQGQLFLAAIMAGLGAVWIFQKPHWGVWVLVVVFFTGISPSFGLRYLGLPYLMSALLLVPLGLSVVHDRRIWVWQVPQIKILAALAVVFLVCTWWSSIQHPVTLIPARDETQRQLELFFSRSVFLVLLLYFVTSRQKIEFTAWLLVGLIVGAAATALWSFIAGGGVGRAATSGEFFGLTKNANRLAFTCLFGTSLVWFYYAFGTNKRWKALILPVLFFLPITALTAGSRSGLLQMLVLTGLAVKEQKGWSANKRIGSVVVVACVVLLALAVVPERFLDRVTSFDPAEHTAGQESLRHRLHLVFVAVQVFVSHPFFGIGIGNNWILQAYYESGIKTAVHNSYLWALMSGGVAALVLYLAMFFITYRMLRQLEQGGPRELLWLSKGLKANLILFLVFTAFADFWLNLFLYMIVGLTIAMFSLWQRQNQRVPLIRPYSTLPLAPSK